MALGDNNETVRHAAAYALGSVGEEAKAAAAALEADLQPLLGGRLVTRMSRHDTNPANNLQVPSEYRS